MPLDKLFGNLGDPSGAVSKLLGSPGSQGALGGAASGAVVSMLMNKKMRKKLSKHAVKVGGAAALAGLGYYAYRQWQGSQGGAEPGAGAALPQASGVVTPPPPPPPPPPADLGLASAEVVVSEPLQVKLVLMMIAASAADGRVDGDEMRVLVEALDGAEIEPAEKAELTKALNEPPPVEVLADLVSSPEEASEMYGAALAAIDVDTPAEHLFLQRFSRATAMEPALVEAVHRAAGEGEGGRR